VVRQVVIPLVVLQVAQQVELLVVDGDEQVALQVAMVVALSVAVLLVDFRFGFLLA
jgi:hypothetical protein